MGKRNLKKIERTPAREANVEPDPFASRFSRLFGSQADSTIGLGGLLSYRNFDEPAEKRYVKDNLQVFGSNL